MTTETFNFTQISKQYFRLVNKNHYFVCVSSLSSVIFDIKSLQSENLCEIHAKVFGVEILKLKHPNKGEKKMITFVLLFDEYGRRKILTNTTQLKSYDIIKINYDQKMITKMNQYSKNSIIKCRDYLITTNLTSNVNFENKNIQIIINNRNEWDRFSKNLNYETITCLSIQEFEDNLSTIVAQMNTKLYTGKEE